MLELQTDTLVLLAISEASTMRIKLLAFLGSCTAVVIASSTIFTVSAKISTAQPEPLKAYQDALLDAADPPQPDEVLDNLTAIDESNLNLIWDNQGRVLVATFAKANRYTSGQKISPPSEIWVTVVPELKDFCTNYKNTGVDNNQLNLRLKQLLGLPPNGEYVKVAEIWVDPQYLKRPTLDPEINDRKIQPLANPIQYPLPFPPDVDRTYQDWFSNLVKNRNNSRYPWTGLGYTYDWGVYPKTNLQTDAGLSEFVILLSSTSVVSTPIEVKRVVSTEKYCKTEDIGMENLTENTPLFVHYQSWTDEITIENKHIKHVHTEYEYDNPVSGNPSGSKQSVLTDTDLTQQQWEDLKTYIRNSGFEKLEDVYGAPEGYRYYPYNLTIGWGTEKKEVKYRSNPSYGEAPLAFKNIENYLFALSEQARK